MCRKLLEKYIGILEKYIGIFFKKINLFLSKTCLYDLVVVKDSKEEEESVGYYD